MTEKSQAKVFPSPAELGRVAVLYGGTSAERDVSLQSGAAVHEGLIEAGVDAVLIDIGPDPLQQLLETEMDVAFIALHGVGGEDGSIQALIEAQNIPHTGSGVAGSALAMDKLRTKQMWRGLRFPTADFKVLSEHSDWASVMINLGGKVMVKPVREGSSVGMSIATDEASLRKAYMEANKHDSTVIAERWLAGREFTVAILDHEALPVIETRTDQDFYTYDAKYISDSTEYICPAPVADALYQEMQQLAVEVFDCLGCRGWGRVDMMLDESGRINLLELNTSPGMTSHSLVPMAAREAGIGFSELVLRVTQLAMGGTA
ncbi:UNVERIFIED_CONTAM: hypothetical protein GTU68_021202 [Idotea baltica]|nr:hypothetical protein [Idotea baltica]